MWFSPKQCVELSWPVSRFIWLKPVNLQDRVGSGQTEVFVCLCLSGPVFPMLAAAFVQFSALCYHWWGCRHTKAERDLHKQAAVGGSVSTHILADPGIPRWLQVSFSGSLHCVLVLLTQAGGIKRERKKKKKNKTEDCPGRFDPASSCSQQVKGQGTCRSCLTLCWALMWIKKPV
jgi:hypothetical protein